MANTFMEHLPMNLPQAAGENISKAFFELHCNTDPPNRVMKLRLFKNDIVPSCNLVLTDLVEADFDGYAEVLIDNPCTGQIQAPAQDVDGNWFIALDMMEFEMTGAVTPNEVFGAYLVDDTFATNILWVGRFATGPFPMDQNGDIIKMTASLPFKCSGLT